MENPIEGFLLNKTNHPAAALLWMNGGIRGGYDLYFLSDETDVDVRRVHMFWDFARGRGETEREESDRMSLLSALSKSYMHPDKIAGELIVRRDIDAVQRELESSKARTVLSDYTHQRRFTENNYNLEMHSFCRNMFNAAYRR